MGASGWAPHDSLERRQRLRPNGGGLCFDLRTRVVVAWICDNCDIVVGLVGLFTSWLDAISARQHKLDDRAASYFSDVSRNDFQSITSDCRRNVTTESRRHGLKERRR